MFLYLYRVTNLINNKFYIGVHKTTDMEDGYMGSGIGIKRAIAKYGRENFEKEILEYFDDESLMFSREKEIVNEETINDKLSYNAKVGGKGGRVCQSVAKMKLRKKLVKA